MSVCGTMTISFTGRGLRGGRVQPPARASEQVGRDAGRIRVKRGEKVGVEVPLGGILSLGMHSLGMHTVWTMAVGDVRTRTTTTLGSWKGGQRAYDSSV